MNRGDIGISIADTAACIICAAVALAWWKRKDWLPQKLVATSTGIITDARWLVSAMSILLITSALAPYVEQRRWPFVWQLMSPTSSGLTQKQVDQRIKPLIVERDKAIADKDDAIKERDAALRDLADTQRQLENANHETAGARAAAAARPPGSMSLEKGETAAVLLLYHSSGGNIEVIAKSTNIKSVETEPFVRNPSDPMSPLCFGGCALFRFVFSGDYGPFDASIADLSASTTRPTIQVTENGEVHLVAILDVEQIGIPNFSIIGTGNTGDLLHEFRMSLYKKTNH